MKKTWKQYAAVLLYTNIGLFLLSVGIYRRLNITHPFVVIEFAAFVMAIFITLGIVIMRSEKGKAWINSAIGFIVILPSLFVLRRVYGVIIFRYSFVLYLFIAGIAIIYGIALIIANRKFHHEANELNQLLKEKNDK